MIHFEKEVGIGYQMDYGHRTIRIHPEILLERGVKPKSVVTIAQGDNIVAAKVWRTKPSAPEEVCLTDPLFFSQDILEPGEPATITSHGTQRVFRVRLVPEKAVEGVEGNPGKLVHAFLDGRPVVENERTPAVYLPTGIGERVGFLPVETQPLEAGLTSEYTQYVIQLGDKEIEPGRHPVEATFGRLMDELNSS